MSHLDRRAPVLVLHLRVALNDVLFYRLGL